MESISAWLMPLVSVGASFLVLLVLTIVVRKLPEVLSEALVKRIQHTYDIRLEKTKAELQESLATLNSSVDLLSSMQSELRKKEIESAEILWKAVIAAKNEFYDLVYIHSIMYPEEITSSLREGDGGPLASVQGYRDNQFMVDKLARISVLPVEETRMFAGEHLWHRLFVFRAFLGRLGILMQESFAANTYVDWREDEFILSQLSTILEESAMESAKKDLLGGTETIVSSLESEFLQESYRVLSGSQAVSDSLPDFHATLMYGAQSTNEMRERGVGDVQSKIGSQL